MQHAFEQLIEKLGWSIAYSAESKHDKNMEHKSYDIIFMFWCNQMIRNEFTFGGMGVRW
jgi:hypothetical protein